MKTTLVDKISHRYRRGTCFAVLVTIFLAGAGSLLFADNGVLIDVSFGFNGAFQVSRSTPVRVRIRNEGPHVEGDLFVHTVSGDGTTLQRIRRHLELQRGARRELSFIVQLRNTSERLSVGFISGEDLLVEQTVDLGRRWYTRPIVTVVGPPGAFDFLLDVPQVQSGAFPLAHIHPEDLPESRYGYDGVKILVLHDLSPADLDTRRVDALASWVETGGFLVVSYGGDPGYFSDPSAPLLELLPVSPAGIRILDRLEIGTEPPVSLPGPVPVVDTGLDDGAAAVRKDHGSGAVVFVPFDATASTLGARAAAGYWTELLSDTPDFSEHEPMLSGIDLLNEVILRKALFGYPGRGKALVTALGCALLFFIVLRVVRADRGKRYAAGLYPGFACTAILGTFLLFFNPGKGPVPVLTSFSYVQGSSEGSRALVWTESRLFSPVPLTADILLPGGTLPVSGTVPLDIRLNREPVLEDVHVGRWDEAGFATRTTVPLGILVETSPGSVSLKNEGNYDLRYAFIIRGSSVTAAGRVSAGEHVEVVLDEDPDNGGPFTMKPVLDPVWKDLSDLELGIMERVVKNRNFLASLEKEPMVVMGFIGDAPFSGSLDTGSWGSYSQALVVLRVKDEQERR